MPMPCLTTDLGALFSADAFGETDGSVEWRGVVISGAIFDDEDVEMSVGDGAAEIAHQAIVTAPSAQFADIAENDPMTVRGRPFRVRFWKDDGTGVIEIYLEAGD